MAQSFNTALPGSGLGKKLLELEIPEFECQLCFTLSGCNIIFLVHKIGRMNPISGSYRGN